MNRNSRNGHGYAQNKRNGYAECHIPHATHATYIVDSAVTSNVTDR